MQIYLSSPLPEAAFTELVQQVMTQQQLMDQVEVSVLPSPAANTQRSWEIASNALTVLAIAVSAGGALTVGMKKDGALTQLAKAIEALVNRKVEVKIKRKNGDIIELSGSAGHIEKILKTLDQ